MECWDEIKLGYGASTGTKANICAILPSMGGGGGSGIICGSDGVVLVSGVFIPL